MISYALKGNVCSGKGLCRHYIQVSQSIEMSISFNQSISQVPDVVDSNQRNCMWRNRISRNILNICEGASNLFIECISVYQVQLGWRWEGASRVVVVRFFPSNQSSSVARVSVTQCGKLASQRSRLPSSICSNLTLLGPAESAIVGFVK